MKDGKEFKRVTRTKFPTATQLLNMAINLRSKYNKASLIEIDSWGYLCQEAPELRFRIYIEDIVSNYYRSWQACLNAYFKLMESK